MRRMSTGNGRWFVVGITLVAIIVAGGLLVRPGLIRASYEEDPEPEPTPETTPASTPVPTLPPTPAPTPNECDDEKKIYEMAIAKYIDATAELWELGNKLYVAGLKLDLSNARLLKIKGKMGDDTVAAIKERISELDKALNKLEEAEESLLEERSERLLEDDKLIEKATKLILEEAADKVIIGPVRGLVLSLIPGGGQVNLAIEACGTVKFLLEGTETVVELVVDITFPYEDEEALRLLREIWSKQNDLEVKKTEKKFKLKEYKRLEEKKAQEESNVKTHTEEVTKLSDLIVELKLSIIDLKIAKMEAKFYYDECKKNIQY